MHPYLSALRDELDRDTAEFEALAALPGATLTRRPQTGGWSLIEVIEHLRITGEQYLPRIARSIDKARHTGGDPNSPFRPSFFARWLLRSVGPDSRLRMKAPAGFQPGPEFTDLAALPRFLEQQALLRELIERADGCDLNRGKFRSPITPLIGFTLGSGFTLLVRHEQRHLLQVRRLRDTKD